MVRRVGGMVRRVGVRMGVRMRMRRERRRMRRERRMVGDGFFEESLNDRTQAYGGAW